VDDPFAARSVSFFRKDSGWKANVSRLRFAVFGAGFWARYQLAAWKQLDKADCVAICDPHLDRAKELARQMGIPAAYASAEALLEKERPGFVDIITAPETHAELTTLAAHRNCNIICQKPMAASLSEADRMLADCSRAGVSLYIHENWRWQTPIRQLAACLVSGEIGQPVRARMEFITAFDDYINQPFLKEIEHLVLTDTGTHILDTARFLFGDVESLYCQTRRVKSDLKGEDMATVVLKTVTNVTVICEMALARIPMEHDYFPQTLIRVEGEHGTAELGPNFWLRVTTTKGTMSRRYPPPRYSWTDPEYDVVQSSMVPCLENLLAGLEGRGQVETTANDNLKTLRLVYAAYESAASDQVFRFD
jgi:D-apiose dehydrogenase